MRFYDVDAIEIDVQDPRFFLDEEKLIEIQEVIAEMLSAYV
jgi:hypothetical protein